MDFIWFCGFYSDFQFDYVTILIVLLFICLPRQKDARGENTEMNYGLDSAGEKEKRTSKRNVDGRSTSSHDNKKFRTRSMEKQRGMAFGFRKQRQLLKKPEE